ncbi:MAG: Ku protein [Alphaproteobacteria bacterium]|nr:Ku protein [Alphaproteobacteria bacterium]
MPAALRPVWTGQLRLALVTVPIKLYAAAQSTARVTFHQIHEPSGQRIRYEKVAPGVGPVPAEEIAKGVEVQKGRYVLLSDAEIAGVKVEGKRTLDLVQFVSPADIDPMFYDTPYFAAPDGKLAQDSFRLVRDALAASKTYGVGQFAMRGRAHVAAVKPYDKGLLVETLRFAEELRRPDAYFEELDAAPADEDLVALARELIARKAAPFDPARFHDDYAEAVERLVAAKVATHGETIIEDAEPAAKDRGAEIVSLVDALKRSLGADRPPAARGRPETPARPAPQRRPPAKPRRKA